MELVDVEAYRAMTSQARTEFDLWLRLTTGLEVGLVHCFEVVIAESFISTAHWLNFGDGVATRYNEETEQNEALWFRQTFDRHKGTWLQHPPISLMSEA